MDGDRPQSPAFNYIPQPGDVIGGYEIVEHIKDGGWGSVYKAVRVTSREHFALKTIKPALAGERKYRELFEREQRALKRLRKHPNLCPAVDWSHDPEHPDRLLWLTMPWIDGPSLSDLIQERGLIEPARAVELIAEAADGLHAVHTAKDGMAHRDLRPANLMIDEEHHLVVIDFGLAKRFEHSSGSPLLPRSGRWNSPEVLEGTELTPRSDIYSLGLILAYILTGEPPVDHAPVLPKHISVPRLLRRTIARATATKPRERYATAADFAAALRDTLAVKAPTPTVARGKALTAATLAALVVFLALTLMPSLSGSEVGPQVSVAEANISAPRGWRPVRVPTTDRKLGLSRAIRGPDALVLIGSLSYEELPAPAPGIRAYNVMLSGGRAVRADGVDSVRAARMFVFRVDDHYLVIVCRPLAGGSTRAARHSCDKIAESVEVSSSPDAIPYPSATLQRQAAAALHGYAKARRKVTAKIEAASTPRDAASAMDAASEAARSLAKRLHETRLRRLRQSLRHAAAAWGTAAHAARRGDRASYSSAGQRVGEAERQIQEARKGLAALGYRT